MRALKEEVRSREGPRAEVHAYGIGGPRLEAEGFRPLVPARALLSMGFVEVLGKLPRIFRVLDDVERAAKLDPPDVAVLLDYPDFHFKLAQRLNRAGIPVICMIPPKIWAWRQGRIETIRKLYRHVFSILPFEEKIYERARVPVTYVGNPLLDELPLRLTRAESRAKLGIRDWERVLLLMPGSRPSELKFHLDPMLEAAQGIQSRLGEKLKILVPFAPTENLETARARVNASPHAEGLDLRVSQGDAWEAMVAADAGIVKSGTSTLEAAVLGCPHVVVYRAHPVSEWIFKKVVRYTKPISLVNLVTGDGVRIVDELILENFRPETMVEKTLPLLDPKNELRIEMLERFKAVRRSLSPGGDERIGPSRRAAMEILRLRREWIEKLRKGVSP